MLSLAEASLAEALEFDGMQGAIYRPSTTLSGEVIPADWGVDDLWRFYVERLVLHDNPFERLPPPTDDDDAAETGGESDLDDDKAAAAAVERAVKASALEQAEQRREAEEEAAAMVIQRAEHARRANRERERATAALEARRTAQRRQEARQAAASAINLGRSLEQRHRKLLHGEAPPQVSTTEQSRATSDEVSSLRSAASRTPRLEADSARSEDSSLQGCISCSGRELSLSVCAGDDAENGGGGGSSASASRRLSPSRGGSARIGGCSPVSPVHRAGGGNRGGSFGRVGNGGSRQSTRPSSPTSSAASSAPLRAAARTAVGAGSTPSRVARVSSASAKGEEQLPASPSVTSCNMPSHEDLAPWSTSPLPQKQPQPMQQQQPRGAGRLQLSRVPRPSREECLDSCRSSRRSGRSALTSARSAALSSPSSGLSSLKPSARGHATVAAVGSPPSRQPQSPPASPFVDVAEWVGGLLPPCHLPAHPRSLTSSGAGSHAAASRTASRASASPGASSPSPPRTVLVASGTTAGGTPSRMTPRGHGTCLQSRGDSPPRRSDAPQPASSATGPPRVASAPALRPLAPTVVEGSGRVLPWSPSHAAAAPAPAPALGSSASDGSTSHSTHGTPHSATTPRVSLRERRGNTGLSVRTPPESFASQPASVATSLAVTPALTPRTPRKPHTPTATALQLQLLRTPRSSGVTPRPASAATPRMTPRMTPRIVSFAPAGSQQPLSLVASSASAPGLLSHKEGDEPVPVLAAAACDASKGAPRRRLNRTWSGISR